MVCSPLQICNFCRTWQTGPRSAYIVGRPEYFQAAALYCSNTDADFFDYIHPPFGRGLIPKKPMLPLIAVPTTAGTGSETTGAAIMDLPEQNCKTGIRLRCIKPLLAIIDPLNVMR